jgi:undecaprenyl-diphosphatase
MDAQAWWDRQWQTLPAHRIDLGGEYEQPLNVQWAGSLECLREHLTRRGWRRAPALNVVNTLRWLQPGARLADLPMLPQVHEGRHDALALVRPVPAPPTTRAAALPDRQLVLRLWPADRVIGQPDTPLWVGTVSRQMARRMLLITVPRTENEFDSPIAALQEGLGGLSWRRATRPSAVEPDRRHWRGTVLLARAPRACAAVDHQP